MTQFEKLSFCSGGNLEKKMAELEQYSRRECVELIMLPGEELE